MQRKPDKTKTKYMPDKPESSSLEMEIDGNDNTDDNRKSVRKVFVKRARDHFVQYSEKTSLHGVQYVGERSRPILERICWVVILAVSIYLCMCLIRKAWIKWNTTPVIVSLSESPSAVWEIPFPAITICPEIKAKKSVFDYTEMLKKNNHTNEEREILNAISLVCNHDRYEYNNNVTDVSALDILEKLAPNFEDIFFRCSFAELEGDCTEFFEKILTSEGWCYSFNILHGSEIFREKVWNSQFFQGNKSLEWSVDKGYEDNEIFNEYPYRAFGIGNKGGLEVLLNAHEYDYDFSCRGPTQGFKMALHNPFDLPQIDQKYLIIPTEERFTVAVKPEMSTTAEELLDYEPSQRKCFFPQEKRLQFYKIYNQENCELECLTNWTLEMCKCVGFHMPHENGTLICGPESAKCMKEAAVSSRLTSFFIEVSKKKVDVEKLAPLSCICLPACTSILYNIETAQAGLEWTDFPKVIPKRVTNTTGIQLTQVNIFYKEFYFTPSRRSELYGRTDFLATCGGLLGLFMGFSFISLIEMFYFLTIRIVGNIALRNRNTWQFLRFRKTQADTI